MLTFLPLRVTLPSESITTPGDLRSSSSPSELAANALCATFTTIRSIFILSSGTLLVTDAPVSIRLSGSSISSRLVPAGSSSSSRCRSRYPSIVAVSLYVPVPRLNEKLPSLPVEVPAIRVLSAAKRATVAYSTASPVVLSMTFPLISESCLASALTPAEIRMMSIAPK